MGSEMQDAAEVAEALRADPSDGGRAMCWSALARVVDDDPVFVFAEGDENGCTITCQVLTGPFVGVEVQAMLGCPLGAASMSPVTKGQRVLLQFLDGVPDGHVVVTHSVPGGKENPLPSVVAGVSLDQALAPENADPAKNAPPAVLFSPPKRVGHREYYRGAIKVIRLKGLQPDFFSGFVVTADDGTTIQMSWNGGISGYGIEIKDSKGAKFTMGDGSIALVSPDGGTRIEVKNGGLVLNSDGNLQAFGSPILLNHNLPVDGPPTPASGGVVVAKAGGAIVGVASISTSVIIGGAA